MPAVVGSFIVHVPAASATDSDTVPDVVPLKLTIPVDDDAVPTVILVPNVGAVANTKGPDPVSSVTADARFADDGVAKNVATPVPRPLTPVLIGNPVAFVRVPDDGVPSAPPLTTKAPADPTLTPRAVATPVPNDVMPVPPLATGRVPVTPVVSGRPVALVKVPLDGVPRTPFWTTIAPAEPTLLAKAVATPVPKPERLPEG